jgi:PEGA domain
MQVAGAILGLVLVAASGSARAATSCISAYEATQVERRAGRLIEARADALLCGQASCPRQMATECVAWAAELEQATPSVVLSFQRPDGSDAVGARVTIDGRPIAQGGLPVPLDPGPHAIRVEQVGFQVLEQQILLQQGEQRRRVVGQLLPLSGGPPPELAVSRTPAIVMTGVGAAALAVGIGFGSAALVEYRQLSSTCAPGCPPGDASQVRLRSVVADVSFAVGIASAVAAAALWLRPTPRATVAVVLGHRTAQVVLEARFGP